MTYNKYNGMDNIFYNAFIASLIKRLSEVSYHNNL